MPRFDHLLTDQMDVEDYLAMKKNSRWGGKSRIQAKHMWAMVENPFPLYDNKQEAENKCLNDGTVVHFSSQSEALRYQALWKQEQLGAIADLQVHPLQVIAQINSYELTWRADFSYTRPDGTEIIEDVKSYNKKKGLWVIGNGATKLRMKLFYEVIRPIDDKIQFYLVDQSSGYHQLYSEAQFI